MGGRVKEMVEQGPPCARRFPRSRGPSLFAFIACAGILAYSVYFIFIVGFDAASTEYRRGLLLYGYCVLALPFSGVGSALFARAILKRHNGLIIDAEGVHDQLSFNGKIYWSNIIGVQQLKPDSESSAFVLQLRDRESYLHYSWTKSFVARGKDELMIYALGLSSAAEIFAAIETGVRTTNFHGQNA